MSYRGISWFKNGIQWDVKFTGFKINSRTGVANRCWNRIAVFVYEDGRDEAIAEAKRVTSQYGYHNVTIDHMVKVK